MNLIPPAIIDLRVPTSEGRHFHLWLPVFLLWPLLWLVELAVLVPAALLDAALWLIGGDYHHYTLFLLRLFGLLGDVRGTIVRVRSAETDIDMAIW